MDLFFEKTWYYLITALASFTCYWALSTKRSLEENASSLKDEVQRDFKEVDNRIVKVENSSTETRISLAEIKGEIKNLASNIRTYKQDKHEIVNENAALSSSLSLCNEALEKASKIIDLYESKER